MEASSSRVSRECNAPQNYSFLDPVLETGLVVAREE